MGSLDMDNVLIHQKDDIFELIRRNTLDDLRIALRELKLLQELWCIENYHYKGRELCGIIKAKLTDAYWDTKNWKRRKKIGDLMIESTDLEKQYWDAECAWKRCG